MLWNNGLYQYREVASAVAAEFSPIPGSQLLYLLFNETDGICTTIPTVRIEINGDIVGGGSVPDMQAACVCTWTDSGVPATLAKGPQKWTPPFPVTMANDKALRVTLTLSGKTFGIVAVFAPPAAA